MKDEYIKEIIKLAKIAYSKNEVPVGAIIVKNGNIIGKGYNCREKCNDISSHAEINAIKDAAKINKSWKLVDCDIYVTMFPCPMCASAIQQSRINNVYYIFNSNDFEINNISKSILQNKRLNHRCNLINIENNYINNDIIDFFKEKRNFKGNVSRETLNK